MDGSVMWISLWDGKGSNMIGTLDLNDCIGNVGGNLVPGTKYGLLSAFLAKGLIYASSAKFYETCSVCGPGDQNHSPPTSFMSCYCDNGKGGANISSIDLSRCCALTL